MNQLGFLHLILLHAWPIFLRSAPIKKKKQESDKFNPREQTNHFTASSKRTCRHIESETPADGGEVGDRGVLKEECPIYSSGTFVARKE